MRLVAMLEGEHQAAAGIVVAEDRAGAVVVRPIGEAGAAEGVVASVIGKGQAATGAMRRAEKGDRAPAGRAQLALGADGRATPEAARRQQQIEQAGGRAAQPALRKGERGHRPMTARRPGVVNRRAAIRPVMLRALPGSAAVAI